MESNIHLYLWDKVLFLFAFVQLSVMHSINAQNLIAIINLEALYYSEATVGKGGRHECERQLCIRVRNFDV